MKKLTNLLLLTLLSVGAMAEVRPVKASLEKATVFLNGAELQHQASVSLKRGENEILIEGLSPVIDKNSLQVSLNNGVVVSAFEYAVDYLSTDKSSKKTQQLQDSLKVYESQLKNTSNALATNLKLQELLLAGVDHSMQVERQAISSDLIEKNLSYFQKRSLQLADEQTALEREKERLNGRISTLKQQIRQDAKQNAQQSGVLTLMLNAPQNGTAQVGIKYFTTRAYWTPFYDLQVSAVGSPVSLILKAHVAQTTGLDWHQTALTLSTGTPSRSNTLPTLGTWLLEQQVPHVYYTRSYAAKAMPTMELAVADAYDEEVSIEEEKASSQTIQNHIQTTEQALMVEYAIDIPYTILGNGKEQTIGLKETKVTDVNYIYKAIPKLSGSVYLTAELNQWEQLSLLDGMANVTFAGTYFGQTRLSTSSTEDALRLTLGEDPEISVKREKLLKQSKTKTAGQNKSVQQVYKITLRNNKKHAVQVSVQEPYPVSTAKEIQVSLTDDTTRWTDNDTAKGILTYKVDLQPGESKELLIGYSVKYPKDWNINF